MSVEEVLVGLQNAVARGQSLEKAVNSLILAGYNVQEIQEAARQINLGIISQVAPETQEEALNGYKKLPAENVQKILLKDNKEKRKFPKWLIVTSIISILVILGAVILGFLGPKILEALK